MNNQWIVVNKNTIEAVKRILLEKDMENSYSELPLMQIYRLFNGAEAEILRLQVELNKKSKEIEALNTKTEEPKESNE